MKRFLALVLGSMLVGGLAFADNESTVKHKSKKSHNVLNGKDTVTDTTEKKVKGDDGSSAKMKKEKSHSVKPDGSTEEKSSSEKSETPAD